MDLFRENLGGQFGGGRMASCLPKGFIDAENTFTMGRDMGEPVRDDQNRDFLSQIAEQFEQAVRMVLINAGRWFIQQKKLGIRGKCPCDKGALQFPTGKGGQRPISKF